MRTLPLGVLRRAIDHASFLASHDPLTKLPNRTLFNDWLDNAVADTERRQKPLAVLCLDLDHFRDINDILGHAVGDELLTQATARIKALLESNDFLARLGGDEFAIVQTDKARPHHATQLASQIISALARPFDLDGNEAHVGASVGITILNLDEQTEASTLLIQADLALYRAKSKCRGSLQFFAEEMNEQLLIRKQLKGDLRRAIPEGQLELEFQPQVDLTTGKVIGVECLLRWSHPTKGRVPPDQFIHLAEESGLIIPIGDWVICQACAQANDWPELKFAVNVCPIQFRQGNIVETVRNALEAEGVSPNRLEIEITEGILLQNTEETIAILTELKAMGVRIAMDDFGTGYSSLNYLRRFDFDKIKIDQSFIAGLGRSTESDCIIQAVIDLGASLGMTSNAEGVETLAQARKLKQQGCKEVQGYFFGRPMPSTSIQELLVDHDWMMLAADDTPSRSTDTDPADVSRPGRKKAKG
ncbi:putative bifunctional diguanylate cyclase/phosphodiesterase [Roseovarius marisflavi]|nr:bifunctional diguanylate cyclase/phosphodiesterase [Roseovarius marisflavi]